MGKKRDLSPCKKSGIKALLQTKIYSNREISRRTGVSENSVRRIKKQVDSGQTLSPKRMGHCGRKRLFTPRSERFLKNVCLKDRFATTKQINSKLQESQVNVSESTLRRKLRDLNFKGCRPAKKPKLTEAMKSKRLKWAREHKDKDLSFWKSVLFK